MKPLSPLWLMPAFILCTSYALAQSSQGGLAVTHPSSSAASYYYISKPGDITMEVNIWGFVEKPGRYEVSSATDLVQLISYAGGPLQDADMDEVKITRIVKRDGVVTSREIVVDLDHLNKVEEAKLVLYPGDTIFIGHTAWLTVRDVFNVVTTAAIVTAAVAQILNYTKK